MKEMIKWLLSSASESDGKGSSNRLTVFGSFLMMCIMAISNQWFGKALEWAVFETFAAVVIGVAANMTVQKMKGNTTTMTSGYVNIPTEQIEVKN